MNRFPVGSPHARALLKTAQAFSIPVEKVLELEPAWFEAELLALRPVVDCSKDPVITKPEAAAGTEIARVVELAAAGGRIEPLPAPDGAVVDQRLTLLDALLTGRAVGEFAAKSDAEARRQFAIESAKAKAAETEAARKAEAERAAAFDAWMAERKAKASQ